MKLMAYGSNDCLARASSLASSPPNALPPHDCEAPSTLIEDAPFERASQRLVSAATFANVAQALRIGPGMPDDQSTGALPVNPALDGDVMTRTPFGSYWSGWPSSYEVGKKPYV